LSLKYLLK